MFNFDEEKRKPQALPEKKKTSNSDFLDASTLIIVAALIVAIVCAFLVKFVFSPEISWRDVGVEGAIICVCTISIYILLRSYTLRRGRRTDAWQRASQRVRDNARKITERNYARYTADYCRGWEQEHLDAAQEAALSRVGIPLGTFRDDYCRYTQKELRGKFPDLTDGEREAIKKARRVRRMKYDERYLYNDEEDGKRQKSPSEQTKCKKKNTFINVRTVVTSVLTCGLSASFFQEVIFNFSAEAVIQCVIKLALVAFFGALGMIGGYNFSTQEEVREMDARADEQERFIKWCETEKDVEKFRGKDGEKLGGMLGADFQPLAKNGVFDAKNTENSIKTGIFE